MHPKAQTTKTGAKSFTAQSTQMESVAVDFKCPECGGEGGSEYASCPVPHCDPDPRIGCSHAKWTFEECEACGGSGLVRCSRCESAPATDLDDWDDEPVCRECLDERRFDASLPDTEPSDPITNASYREMAEYYRERGI